ncbi:putative Cytochrome c' [Candidatus Terasakiella magnetica]|uniref:Putative Cytochrome c n=1 Tax=Candidatus Terasakiella magnetica TaxID=1867952 RepID=A0A1C3RD15_9PROT|nr:cytochrome c [Candidatus Terasakiella magnetica]SCA55147.1 putative Cytochrome c' [Candidatus Terasakiella magnetica]
MKKIILAACVCATAFIGVAYEAFAAENNPAIVHRQSTYKVVGGHMGSLKSILFLGGKGDTVYHAESIKAAWDHMGKAYPKGSDVGETRAKPEIWTNMDAYMEKGKAAYGATLSLVEAAKSGDQAAQVEAFKTLGGACKACHKEFRKK